MKKVLSIIFCISFVLLLLLPVFFFNFAVEQKSEIDNAFLPEIDLESLSRDSIHDYIVKRVGFRAESLLAYLMINDKLFGIMEHPIYMYGKDKWVWYNAKESILAFQHLNSDAEYAKRFASSVEKLYEYAKCRDITFIYFLAPDKETIYPEYYPAGINIFNAKPLAQQCIEAIEQAGIPCYYSKEQMMEAKEYELVNNIKYDAAHWNDNGAFVSFLGLYERLSEAFPELVCLDENDYIKESENITSLSASHYPINEEVPKYSLINDTAISDTNFQNEFAPYIPNTRSNRYLNSQAPNKLKILLFGDSYLGGKEMFFTPYFLECTIIHRDNISGDFDWYSDYIDRLNPDIVIFEMPERCFPIDYLAY